MISTIVILLIITATIMAIAVKTETMMSLTKSIILGLTTAPFLIIVLALNVVNLIANLGLKLGLALGGSNIEELLASYLTRQLKDGKVKVRGDESENKPEEDDLH